MARLRERLTDALGVEVLNRSEAVVFGQADEQGAARPVGERAQRLGRGARQTSRSRLHLDVGGFEPQSAQSIDQRVDTVIHSHGNFTSLSQLSHSLANSFTTPSHGERVVEVSDRDHRDVTDQTTSATTFSASLTRRRPDISSGKSSSRVEPRARVSAASPAARRATPSTRRLNLTASVSPGQGTSTSFRTDQFARGIRVPSEPQSLGSNCTSGRRPPRQSQSPKLEIRAV